jgi:transposase-like protein
LIQIKNGIRRFGHGLSMAIPPSPKPRHCPICGVAMQASKSQDNHAEFERFECLSCHTVIREKSSEKGGEDKS